MRSGLAGRPCYVEIMPPKPHLTVFFDGACAFCRRQVAFWRRQDRRGRIDWRDISQDARALLGTGISHRQALHKVHARTRHGRTLTGARALLAIMDELPGFRTPARVLTLPPLVWLLEGFYHLFLPLRARLTGRNRDCCGEEN